MERQCESHEQLVTEIQRMHNDMSELYGLDRERGKQLTTISVSVAHIEEKQDALSNKIEQVFVEFERQMNASSATINKLLDNRQEKKWKPANIVALISALGGFSGLAAVLIIFIK